MENKSLVAKATALAASQPSHLGQPTIPPLDWHQEGEILTVIMADGRKVSANIRDINVSLFDDGDPIRKSVGANGVRPFSGKLTRSARQEYRPPSAAGLP
jgi:hypothetical protein